MRTQVTKLSLVLYLAAILVVGMGLDVRCAGPDPNEVRQPPAGQHPDTFWDAFDWDELTAAEQTLWGVLGWDEASWQGNADPPASESKDWHELTAAEQDAAMQLGYNQAYWDS